VRVRGGKSSCQRKNQYELIKGVTTGLFVLSNAKKRPFAKGKKNRFIQRDGNRRAQKFSLHLVFRGSKKRVQPGGKEIQSESRKKGGSNKLSQIGKRKILLWRGNLIKGHRY